MAGAVKLKAVPEAGPPVTIQDCANLALASYTDFSNPNGWTQISHQGFGDDAEGFFGAAYRRNKDIIVAFRGTSDLQDIIDDAGMAPFKTPAEARTFGVEFMRKYTTTNELATQNIAKAVELAWKAKILERGKWLLFGERLNTLPSSQMTELDKFLFRLGDEVLGYGFRIRAFVGHSLGGALAQAASENYSQGPFRIKDITGERHVFKRISIPAVGFNSPYMGTISGMQKGHGPGILCVNTKHDPLSIATQLAGNASHAAFTETVEGKHMPRHGGEQFDGFLIWLSGELAWGHSMPFLRNALQDGLGRKKLSAYFPPTMGIDD